MSHALFDRLRIRKGWKVLEIGPGQGSLHMELRRRVHGPVDIVERSPVFAKSLARLCRADGLGTGQLWQSDLIDAPLPPERYDLIFARWVFLFLPNPEAHIRKLARSLKPGGRLALQDYHRETFAMVPRPEEWTRFAEADLAFFATQGGDVSIGGRLPALYERAGLSVEDVEITIKSGRPGSPVWKWLSNYFLGIMGRYSRVPPFTRADAIGLRRQWLAAAREDTSLLVGPAVLDVVGRKLAVLLVIGWALFSGACSPAESPNPPPAVSDPVRSEPATPSVERRPTITVGPVTGVRRVAFGTAQRTPGTGGLSTCTIPDPLPEPALFAPGTREISYIVELEPRSVKSAATEVIAPEGQGQLLGVHCNGFTIITGGFSQTQLGNTISRLDKNPLKPGTYILRITVDGESADVPFVVK